MEKLKEWAAEFFFSWHKERTYPSKYINRAVEIIKKDPDNAHYAEKIENWKFDE